LPDRVGATDEGERLDAQELLAMTFLLLIAGYVTTVSLIGNGTLALLRQPEQLGRGGSRSCSASTARSTPGSPDSRSRTWRSAGCRSRGGTWSCSPSRPPTGTPGASPPRT